MKCSEYVTREREEWEHRTPCKCPVCGGFLKWENYPKPNTPICNKCGTELIMLPEVDEESGEEMEWGKICPISERQSPNQTKAATP